MTQVNQEAAHPPKEFEFFVNGQKYTTEQQTLTGLQIKAKVPNWDPNHDLVLEGHGAGADRPIADGETVDLTKDNGPLRFSSVPKANFG